MVQKSEALQAQLEKQAMDSERSSVAFGSKAPEQPVPAPPTMRSIRRRGARNKYVEESDEEMDEG